MHNPHRLFHIEKARKTVSNHIARQLSLQISDEALNEVALREEALKTAKQDHAKAIGKVVDEVFRNMSRI